LPYGTEVFPRQAQGPAGLLDGAHTLQTVIAVEVDPSLHEVLASRQLAHDLGLGQAIQRRQNGTPTISLLGIALLPDSVTQFVKVRQTVGRNVHGILSIRCPRIAQSASGRNPYMP
jgi:hypothetical protein